MSYEHTSCLLVSEETIYSFDMHVSCQCQVKHADAQTYLQICPSICIEVHTNQQVWHKKPLNFNRMKSVKLINLPNATATE